LQSNLEVGFNLARGWVTHLTSVDELLASPVA